ncbi:MAG: hypothetical protein COB04_05240 [Gammaproteobacteria bacterium]|nr:MAG: hypothetical protein COB04_05240 [Gammaproteobacteria bacterium]
MPTTDSSITKQLPEEFADKENNYIEQRRSMLDLPNLAESPKVGLAFSGGGIRSACFNLGVSKRLAKDGIFKHVDVLSTVSGGGYIGSAISWFYKHTTTPDKFPFGTQSPLEKHRDSTREQSDSQQWEEKLRYGANYLTPSKDINGFSLLGAVTKAMLSNIIVWGLLSCALFLLMISLKVSDVTFFGLSNLASLVLTALFVTFVISASFLSYSKSASKQFLYKVRTDFAIVSSKSFGVLLLLVVIGTLPAVHGIFNDYQAQYGTIGLVFGLLGLGKGALGDGSPANWKLVAYASSVLYGLLFGAYSVAVLIAAAYSTSATLIIAFVFLGFSIAMGIFCNTNQLSVTHYYRDRLMELFLPNLSNNTQANEQDMQANDFQLSELNQHAGPYHIINCNIVLADSANQLYQSRGGDNFIYSPFACGSSATGWAATQKDITLATAMATSGAAASPNAGCGGAGVTRNRVISFTMRLLNIRMGMWSTNPRFKNASKEKDQEKKYNHFTPGFSKAIGQGKGLSEDSRTIELTDGGHFSNLAMYELARRKMPVIIVCDAGADSNYIFADFKVSCDRIRTDFGYTIKMHSSVETKINHPALSDLVPSQETHYPRESKFSRRGHLFGVINYEPGKAVREAAHGLIIYLKPALLESLPRELLNYKGNNPSFPNVSTGDQFFDEDQVTSYSALGYEIAGLMINEISQVRDIINEYPKMLIDFNQFEAIFNRKKNACRPKASNEKDPTPEYNES